MHGPHHVAKKFINTTLPLASFKSKSLPSIVLRWIEGAATPILVKVVSSKSAGCASNENELKQKARSNNFFIFLNSNLPVADAKPFIARQFFQAHRAARADFVGADADFRAHAKFAAVGETR
jgi:hypothetical protein